MKVNHELDAKNSVSVSTCIPRSRMRSKTPRTLRVSMDSSPCARVTGSICSISPTRAFICSVSTRMAWYCSLNRRSNNFSKRHARRHGDEKIQRQQRLLDQRDDGDVGDDQQAVQARVHEVTA